jgi:hypothetical protein
MLPAWIAGALCLLVVGAGILVMAFARLRPPAVNLNEVWSVPADEGSVPPAVVTLLLSRSQSNVLPAMRAAFFRLVRDGHLSVEKRAGKLRGAAFDVREGTAGRARSPHEEWIVERVRRERDRPDLRRIMMQMSRRQREFGAALMSEAASLGWIDGERRRARSWLIATGIVLVASGVVGLGVTAALAERFGPAPVVIPAALLVVGLIYVIASAGMSVLSESGVREAARWRARVSELKSIIANGASGQSPLDFERWFPLAIGANLGRRWLKVFSPILTAGNPELGWLKLMGSPADATESLGAMVAVSHSSYSGGAGGAGGGAGGGSSGAG